MKPGELEGVRRLPDLSASHSRAPGIAALAAPGNLLEMPILQSQPGTETLRLKPSRLCVTRLPGDAGAHDSLRNAAIQDQEASRTPKKVADLPKVTKPADGRTVIFK